MSCGSRLLQIEYLMRGFWRDIDFYYFDVRL
jgi:hypothetical protein